MPPEGRYAASSARKSTSLAWTFSEELAFAPRGWTCGVVMATEIAGVGMGHL